MIGVRTFIAISLCDEIKKGLGEIVAELKETKADVRWVNPQSIHLTLKFLGHVEIGQLEPIFEMAAQTASEVNTFAISFGSLGGFPNLSHPRVVWVGVDKGKEEIIRLASLMEANLSRLGFEAEKKGLIPHLTLGRVKSSQGMDRLIKLIPSIETSCLGEMEVAKLVVMGSQLTKEGAIHTALKVLPLRKS